VRPRLTPARKPSDPALIRPGLISAKGRNWPTSSTVST